MDVRVSSRIAVTVQIEPGAWVVTNAQGDEIAIVSAEVVFHDGIPSGFVPSTVRRNKGGEWGKASGGYYHVPYFADAPAGLRRTVLGAFHEHLQHANTTAEKYWENNR